MTGGEDDRAFVWHVSDGELLFECTGEVCQKQKSLQSVLAGNIVSNRSHIIILSHPSDDVPWGLTHTCKNNRYSKHIFGILIKRHIDFLI